MDGELAYYAALSGLTPAEDFSLADHKFDYFSGVSGLSPAESYSLSDHMRVFYRSEVPAAPDYFSLTDLEFLWFRIEAGFDGDIAAMKLAVFGGAAPPPPPDPIVGTFIGANGSVSDTSSYTFLAEPIGVAGATRRVVVGVCTRDLGGEAQPTSVTIGGIAAARDGTGSDETVWAEAWSAVVPAGATADIVVTLPFTSSGCGIGVWSLDKGAPSGESVGAGGAAVVPLVLTTEADDFVIAVVHDRVTVLGPSVAFASGTERYDTAFDGAVRQHAGADAVAVGASVDMTATITNFTVDSAGVAVGYRA